MDVNEYLGMFSEINEVFLQVCNSSGEVLSLKRYTQEDMQKIANQWALLESKEISSFSEYMLDNIMLNVNNGKN